MSAIDRRSLLTARQHFQSGKADKRSAIVLAFCNAAITTGSGWGQTVLNVASPARLVRNANTSVGGVNSVVTPERRGAQSRTIDQLIDIQTGQMKQEPTAPFAPPGSRFNDFTVSHKARKLAVGGIDANRRGFVTVWSLGEESTAPP
jgi:hypothetical protein